MNKSLFILLFIAFRVLESAVLLAQNAEQDLKKVNDYVNNATELWLDVEYKVFSSWESKNPVETTLSTIKKSGEQSYMLMKPLEVLQTTSYSVSVNSDTKSIQIAEKSGTDKKKAIPASNVDYKSMLANCKSVVYAQIGDDKASYTLTADFGYKKTIITFNSKSFRPLSAEIHYLGSVGDNGEMDNKKNPKMILTYKRIDRKPVFENNDFSTDRFFTVKDKKYLPALPYKAYTINGKTIN